jgi:hypothetical protein
MKPLPLPVRLAAGILATAVEQARDLPRQLAELPITAVSQTLQAGMRMQQRVTELAIKGDRALSVLQPVEEKPSWATFDDDLEEEYGSEPYEADAPTEEFRTNGARSRTVTPIDVARAAAPAPDADPVDRIDAVDDLDSLDDAEALALIDEAEDEEGGAVPVPPPAGPPAFAEYPQLSIPQLRGRLRFLTLAELRSLLDWELDHDARPPYITMLQNRITTVSEG